MNAFYYHAIFHLWPTVHNFAINGGFFLFFTFSVYQLKTVIKKNQQPKPLECLESN